MIKKALILLLFPGIAALVASCCNCGAAVIWHYTHKSITISHLDNAGSTVVPATSDSIIKTAYGIRLQLMREKMASIQKPNALLFQSAWAFKCGCEPALQFLPKDSLLSIQVFTLQAFDGAHPAGADITAYFKVYRYSSFMAVDEYIKYNSPTLYSESELTGDTDLLLMKPPTTTTRQQFRLQMTLSDGRVLTTETSTVQLI